MDISALSDDNFNAVDWINAQYRKYAEENEAKSSEGSKAAAEGGGVEDDEEKNTLALEFINSYVSKLQLYVQQVNYAVEESSQQLVAMMPRIIGETETLQKDVIGLQKRMKDMNAEMTGVQEETGNCMATLEHLNKLQTDLQAAKESLQESDGWGNLIGELEDCFERKELKGVCEKLVALQKSLQAQEQLDGHADRLQQVEDFKNRLEALASPNVVQCFAELNLEQAQSFVSIFSGIQRLPQLLQYYRAVQKNALQQHWRQALELQQTETPQQIFLTQFYDQLLEHCQRQVKWCTQVFGDSDGGQLQPFFVVAELLPSLQPTRDAHILQLLKSTNERLELLAQFAQANHGFVLHLNAFLEQSPGLTLPPELRLSVGEAIYEYFHKFIQQYPRLEETQLSTQVDRLIVSQVTAVDAVRHLEDSGRKVFDWLQEACQRCANITSDLALCKLIGNLSGIFKRVLDNFAKTERQLSLSVGNGSGNVGGTTENWSMLQCTMSLLQCLADFQVKLQKFEKTLHGRMSTLAEKLNGNTSRVTGTGAISIYDTYDRGEQKRLLATIADYQQKRSDATSATSQTLSLGIFTNIYDSLKSHFTETHEIALSILLQPIEAHLANIQPPAEAHRNSPHIADDMPSFSYAPQECITQIGQYLLTLPQHLEPVLLSPSPLLKQALEYCHIKYAQHDVSADILLSLVVEQCCLLYQSQILQIKTLPSATAKQLAVDIEYLSNVLEELGLSISLHLSQLLTLLKASPENYLTLSSGCEPRLVTAIRQMRNIISTQ